MTDRFVCVFNRNRDAYDVAIGLDQAGLLDRLVTDFYASDQPPAWLPAPLRRRRSPLLAHARTVQSWPSFIVQAIGHVLGIPGHVVFPRTNRMLANKAASVARKRGTGLYCYHDYLPENVPAGRPLVLFVYHPLPACELNVLASDAARYPEAASALASTKPMLEQQWADFDWHRVDAVVCASTFTAGSVIAAGCDPARIEIIPYGAPDRAERQPPQARPEGPVRFLFVGQGVQRKGLHHLIRAWQACPRPGAKLTLVCYRIDPAIQALIDDPTIELRSYVEKDELEALYRRSHVFVMPSLIEGFGLVYLDALAHGCHVIGTANTGLPDMDCSPQMATLVEPGDIAALAAAIDDLIVRAPGFDCGAIAEAAGRWTRADFHRAIGEHAGKILALR